MATGWWPNWRGRTRSTPGKKPFCGSFSCGFDGIAAGSPLAREAAGTTPTLLTELSHRLWRKADNGPTRTPTEPRRMSVLLTDPTILLAGVVLALFQFLAALPWLYAIDPKGFRDTASSGSSMAYVGGGLLAVGIALATFMAYKHDAQYLVWYGRYVYGAILHLQLLIDLFLLLPHVLVLLWPKGGAVAFAAYREACRQ